MPKGKSASDGHKIKFKNVISVKNVKKIPIYLILEFLFFWEIVIWYLYVVNLVCNYKLLCFKILRKYLIGADLVKSPGPEYITIGFIASNVQ